MYKIGDFSKLSFLTIQTLRHYDDMGLLKPAKTDDSSGYRYYRAEQLLVANLITVLKNVGLSLPDVKRVMQQTDPNAIRVVLEEQRKQLQDELDERQKMLSRLAQMIDQLQGGQPPSTFPVVIKKLETQLVASLRQVLPNLSGQVIGAMFGELVAFIMQSGAGFAGPTMMVYNDADFREEGADIEVCAPIAEPTAAAGRVTTYTTTASPQVASLVYQGRYEDMGLAYQELMSWVARSGYRVDGVCRELYLVSPADTQDPNRYVTELQVPFGPIDSV